MKTQMYFGIWRYSQWLIIQLWSDYFSVHCRLLTCKRICFCCLIFGFCSCRRLGSQLGSCFHICLITVGSWSGCQMREWIPYLSHPVQEMTCKTLLDEADPWPAWGCHSVSCIHIDSERAAALEVWCHESSLFRSFQNQFRRLSCCFLL